MGLGALCLLERFNKSEPLYMLCMFTSAVCSFVYPFTTKPLGKQDQMRRWYSRILPRKSKYRVTHQVDNYIILLTFIW